MRADPALRVNKPSPGDRDANGNSFADDVRSDAPRGGREDGEPR